MWPPKFAMRNQQIGSGSVVGKNNIVELLDHISKYEGIGEKSIAELAPDYETAMFCLVMMIESKFISLHPCLQYMFLKLNEIEDREKKDFILETLLRKFKNEALEARKIFARFDMLGSDIDVPDIFSYIKVDPEKIHVSIPLKLVGIHEAYEKNYDWIVPKNLFDGSSPPESAEKGVSKTTIDKIECLAEIISTIDLGVDAPPLDNT